MCVFFDPALAVVVLNNLCYSSDGIEFLAVRLTQRNLLPCYIMLVYIAPEVKLESALSRLSTTLNRIASPHKVLVGDFNPKETDMPIITQFAADHRFRQLVQGSTHRKGRTLDLLFTTIRDTEVSISEEVSDHMLLKISIPLSLSHIPNLQTPNSRPIAREVITFREGKWPALNDKLSSLGLNELILDDVHEMEVIKIKREYNTGLYFKEETHKRP